MLPTQHSRDVRTWDTAAERHPIRAVVVLVAAKVEDELLGSLLEVAAVGTTTQAPVDRHGCGRHP